jgi:branched-chain amino acid transport system permease protein
MRGRGGRLAGQAAVAVVGVAALAAPYVLTSYTIGLLTLVMVAALLAASIYLLAQAGLVSAGHAGLAAAAGYGLAYATTHGQPWPAALAVALAATLLVAAVYAVTSMRTAAIYFLMVTLALGMVVYGLAFRLNRLTGGENGLTGIDRPPGIAEYWQFYFLCLAVLAATLLGLWVLGRSPFGLALRGIRDSESRMRSLGYNVAAYKFHAFLLSGLIAGLSGVLATYQAEYISPSSASFARSALGVVMVILGGTGALLGPVAGAAVVVLSENVLSGYVERWPTVLGLVFIAVVLFVPQGLAGIAAAATRLLRGAPGRAPQPSPQPERSPDPTPEPPLRRSDHVA